MENRDIKGKPTKCIICCHIKYMIPQGSGKLIKIRTLPPELADHPSKMQFPANCWEEITD